MSGNIIDKALLHLIEVRVKSATPGPWEIHGMTRLPHDPGPRPMRREDLISYFRNPQGWEDVWIGEVNGDPREPPVFDFRVDEDAEFQGRLDNFEFLKHIRQDSERLVDALKLALERIHVLERRVDYEARRRRELERSKPA